MQTHGTNQTIGRVRVIQSTNCPPGSGGGNVKITNRGKAGMTSVMNMKNLDALDLARKVSTQLEDSVHALVKSERRGTEAISGDNKTLQQFKVNDTTVESVRVAIQNVITTNIVQDDEDSQTIREVFVQAPCTGNVELTNEMFTEKLATDLIENITSAIVKSEEVTAVKLSAGAESTSTSTGTIASETVIHRG